MTNRTEIKIDEYGLYVVKMFLPDIDVMGLMDKLTDKKVEGYVLYDVDGHFMTLEPSHPNDPWIGLGAHHDGEYIQFHGQITLEGDDRLDGTIWDRMQEAMTTDDLDANEAPPSFSLGLDDRLAIASAMKRILN